MARHILRDCVKILWWQIYKSQDNPWVTRDKGQKPSPPKDTRKHWVTMNKRPSGSMRTQRGSQQDDLRSQPHGPPLFRCINSPTFCPPPAMRLLMYSGPSLFLRAFWMAWYSSAVYWYFSTERKLNWHLQYSLHQQVSNFLDSTLSYTLKKNHGP